MHVVLYMYVYIGPDDKDGNKCFLSVMSYKNQSETTVTLHEVVIYDSF